MNEFPSTHFKTHATARAERWSAVARIYLHHEETIRKPAASDDAIGIDLAAAGTKTGMDPRLNYTLYWLPPAIIKVRPRCICTGDAFGNWRRWQSWTLTPGVTR